MYHKPTHTDQYLQWDSHHSLSAKYSVIGTLTHRVKQFALTQTFSRGNTLRRLWVGVITPHWAINKVQTKVLNSNQEDHSNNNLQNTSNNTTNSLEQQIQTRENNSNQTKANNNQGTSTTTPTSSRPNSTAGQVVIPYTKGLAESFKHIVCG